jgi:hypothetical protein
MKECKMKIAVILIYGFYQTNFYAQNLPNVNTPQPSTFSNYQNQSWLNPQNNMPNVPNALDLFRGKDEPSRINQQNQKIINEVEQNQIRQQEALNEIYREIQIQNISINYNLPSFSHLKETSFYVETFKKMSNLDVENFSIKDVNFEIENTYFQNKKDKGEFDKIIKSSGEFILAKMKELKYDSNSNLAKNFMLFQFFSETIQLKNNGQKHDAFKYDFEDYLGIKDHSKMFVSKLISTQSGQCHSMPLLYLILAEEIGAEAYLSTSPNHSFIKFKDENNKWYNIELTNGMFTTPSFMINSGYIKAEALQNKIYLQNLTKQELLSNFYVDLANGYIHKFGYDDFINEVVSKSIELNPNNINAQMIKANYLAQRFEYVCYQLKINPRDNKQLQNIHNYPKVVEMLHQVNQQNKLIDNLGYSQMPAEAYEKWLDSLQEEKNKQENENLKKQFKIKIKQPLKN